MIDAMKQAMYLIEAWERGAYAEEYPNEIDALRQAIEQAEKQEPVAYLCENAVGHKYFRWKKPTSHYKPIALYTAPPHKKWVGLTDDDLRQIILVSIGVAEAKLKGKNGG